MACIAGIAKSWEIYVQMLEYYSPLWMNKFISFPAYKIVKYVKYVKFVDYGSGNWDSYYSLKNLQSLEFIQKTKSARFLK